MQVQIKAWGNSQGIRLSKESLAIADFHEGDTLELLVSPNQIVIQKSFVHKSLRERAASYGGELHLEEAYDWGEPAGNEVW